MGAMLSLLLADGRLPTGGFAHSGGLEAGGQRRAAADARAFMAARLRTPSRLLDARSLRRRVGAGREQTLSWLDGELGGTDARARPRATRAARLGSRAAARRRALWPGAALLAAYARALVGHAAAGCLRACWRRRRAGAAAAGACCRSTTTRPRSRARRSSSAAARRRSSRRAWLARGAGWARLTSPRTLAAARGVRRAALPASATPLLDLRAPAHHDTREERSLSAERALRVGIGGPVGTGKSSLIAALCGALASEHGDRRRHQRHLHRPRTPRFLRSQGVLAPERIVAVQTGCCPHTAIRDDVSANLLAVEDAGGRAGAARRGLRRVRRRQPDRDLLRPRSPTRRSSCLDCAGGDDVPRKGGPGVDARRPAR